MTDVKKTEVGRPNEKHEGGSGKYEEDRRFSYHKEILHTINKQKKVPVDYPGTFLI
jgi:hypothetical protein